MCELCVSQACGKFNELTNIGANQQQAPAQQNQPAGQGQQDSGSK
jgi:hypothetical protein